MSGPPTRRSSAAVERAILDATLAELAVSGYLGLALDRVAKRAGTGRAPLYRRWSSKRDLVADAIAQALPAVDGPPRTGKLREDLLAYLTQMHRLVDGPAMTSVQVVIAELHDPSAGPLIALVRERVLEPRLQIILDILLAGAGRGEIRAEAATPILAKTGPALLLQHLLMYGTPAPPAVIEEIVDRVILPAASPR